MTAILRTRMLSAFSCLGDKCEDTCCQGWSMQMDQPTLARYREQAPELLDAVEQVDDASWIMRKDPASSLCVKLEGGLCGIHKTYGENFLGDACYFYPRVTRRLGNQVVMSAGMSCPEITRLALNGEQPCTLEEVNIERLPQAMKDYLPPDVTPEEALTVHRAFIAATEDNAASAERIFLRMASASRSLERVDRKSWPAMAAFYMHNADKRIPPAETDINDPFNLLHALCGLVAASRKKPSQRLQQTISDMEKALAVTLDWEKVLIHASDHSLQSYRNRRALWRDEAAALYAPVLRRWLQMQMSLALWPFAGFGNTLSERITVIGVRLATIRLALMCSCGINGTSLPQDVVVRVVQSLSRFMDHLGDPVFSLQIYAETGWVKEFRMRGLLEA